MIDTTATFTEGPELTYDEAAEIIGVSPRAVRTVLKQHPKLCPRIFYSYRKIRFPLNGVLAVKKARRDTAIKKGRAL